MLESGAAQTKLQRDERDALTRQQQIGFSRRFYGSIGSKSTERTKLAGEPLSPSPSLSSPSSSVSLGFLLAADHGSTNNENICCIFNIILTLDEIVSVFTKIIDHQLVSYAWGVYSEVDSTKRVEFPSTRRFYMAKTLMLPSSRSIHSLPPSVTEQRE